MRVGDKATAPGNAMFLSQGFQTLSLTGSSACGEVITWLIFCVPVKNIPRAFAGNHFHPKCFCPKSLLVEIFGFFLIFKISLQTLPLFLHKF